MSYEAFGKLSREIAVGLAATGGLMCAATVSGLPGVTCQPLAKIYIDGIVLFGLAGASGLVAIFMISMRKPHDWVTVAFVCFTLSIGVVSVTLEILRANNILVDAFARCWH